MGRVLVVGEMKQGGLAASAGELLGAARLLGDEVEGALLGSGSSPAGADFGKYGVARVHVLDGDLPHYSGDAFAAALAQLISTEGYEYVILMQSFFGRDLGARLAAKLSAAWVNDITGITGSSGNVSFTKPLYAGKVIGTFVAKGEGVKVLTLRPKVFSAVAKAEGSAQCVAMPAAQSMLARVTAVQAKAAGEIDLKDADIIVSGGRGLGGPEGFEPLREFANAIGAALGASRATVDAGWIPHKHQVGQTGKTVNPKLYIACGISGAIQHLAGMQTSRCIVAINSNESAPIFKVADYGLVGDVFEIVPELQKQIVAAQKARGG